MSKSPAPPSPEASKPLKSYAGPIDVLSSPIAQTYTHVHPVLLLTTYSLAFSAIVADPATTLTYGLIPLAGLQVAYLVACLPVTDGASSAPAEKPKEEKEKEKGKGRPRAKKAKAEATVGGRIFTAVLSLVFAGMLAAPTLGVLLVLFGAPVTSHIPETALCAAHAAMLVAPPLVYTLGVDGERWREVLALLRPVDEVMGAAVGTLLGAWVGAVPIPLDWDREWQKWPVTIVTGAYLGFAVGKTVGGLPFVKGSKIRFE